MPELVKINVTPVSLPNEGEVILYLEEVSGRLKLKATQADGSTVVVLE